MKVLKSLLGYGLLFVVLLGVGTVLIVYYPYIFSKTVQGEIIEIERITEPTAILGRNTPDAMIHSYAVLIQDQQGVMFTASSEDRQWEVAKKGYCAIALFYRYPPWNFDKANTFFNARLQKIYRCPGKADVPEVENAPVTEPVIEGEPQEPAL